MPSDRRDKPALTLEQQVEVLRARGLAVADADAAASKLLDANYYRLSGYLRQQQIDPKGGNDNFEPGATFDEAIEAYDYDLEFSELIRSGLCIVERVIRARFAYYLAQEHGNRAFFLEEDAYLDVTPDLHDHLYKLGAELRRSKSPTVRRYEDEGGFASVPIWVAIELFSFGAVSKMLDFLRDSTAARSTAHSLSLPWAGFTSTIHSLSVLRNTVAHHGQTWHRRLAVQTPIVKTEKRHWPNFDPQGPWPAALAILRILRKIDRSCNEASRLETFMQCDCRMREGLLFPSPR